MSTDSNAAHGNSHDAWIDHLAWALNFFALSVFLLFIVLVLGVVELGSVIGRWLMDDHHAKET